MSEHDEGDRMGAMTKQQETEPNMVAGDGNAVPEVKAGDVIRFPLYICGHEYDAWEGPVELFRGCLGVFRSPENRKAAAFTPLCDLYKPAPDATQGYIPNWGEYHDKHVLCFTVVRSGGGAQ